MSQRPEGNPTPLPSDSESGEKYQRDPELDTAYECLDDIKLKQEKLITQASPRRQPSYTKELAETIAMTGVLRSIENAIQKPDNRRTWREHLDFLHSNPTFWDNKANKAQARGDKAVEYVDLQESAVLHYYDKLSPQYLSNFLLLKKSREHQELQNDASAEKINPALAIIIEETYHKGRTAMTTSISAEFAGTRGLYSGFKEIVDQRDLSKLKNSTNETHFTFNVTTHIGELMQKSDITTAIAIEQARDNSTNDQQAIPMSTYTGDKSDTSPAYRVTYVVNGLDPVQNKKKEFQYRDPQTNRHGNLLIATIHAPKDVAEKAFTVMQKDRATALKILARFDPELIADQRDYIPDDHGTFVLPEGQADQAFDRNQNGIALQIKPDFIR